MTRLCDICAGLSWPEILQPNGTRRHSLAQLVAYATLTNVPCPLCKLIWWSLRFDHGWLESQVPLDLPVWLWRTRKDGNMITVLTGQALLSEISIEEMQFDFIEHISHLETPHSLAIGNLCLYSIRDQPATLGFDQMVIEPDPSSERALRMAERQVRACIDDRVEHFDCFRDVNSGYPKRVIDVKAGSDLNILRLRDVAESGLDGQHLEYVALSYCWGEGPRFVTTSSNLAANKAKFYLADLPPTIKDAVAITRGLNVRYLWVDGLCIVQGHDETARDDWKAESERMDVIYGNALLTISAASAKTAFEGFLLPRAALSNPVSVTLPQSLQNHPGEGRLVISPEHQLTPEKLEPLSKRAWALQEKMLSRRSLIYGTSEIIFVCRKGEWRESGHKEKYAQHLSDWQATVEDYSVRSMTDSWDRLTAIQGLADYFTRTQGVQILQGMRPQCLARDLLWQHTDSTGLCLAQPTVNRAPSWSWGAVDGPVKFHKPADYYIPLADLRCERIELDEGKTKLVRSVLRGNGEFVHVNSIKWQARAMYDAHAHSCCPLAFLGSSTRTFLDCPDLHKHDTIANKRHDWKELHDVWFLYLFGTAGLILKAVPALARTRRRDAVWPRKRTARASSFQRIGIFTARAEDIRGERHTLTDITIY